MKYLFMSLILLSAQGFAQTATPAKEESKSKELIAATARGAGLGSTVVTRTLLKQYVFAAAWVKGLVGNARKQEASLAAIDILLRDENLQKFDKITNESNSWENYIESMQDETEKIFKSYVKSVWVSVLHDIDSSISKTADFDQLDLTKIDFSKLTTDVLTQNADYQELEKLIGEVDEREILDSLSKRNRADLLTTEQGVAKDVEDQLHDLTKDPVQNIDVGAAVAGHLLITPLLVKGVFGTAVMGAYNWVAIPALAGTGITAWQCLRPATQEKIDFEGKVEDQNLMKLQKFCRKALNTSAYQVLLSRMKGLRAGHNTKLWSERAWKNVSKPFRKKK